MVNLHQQTTSLELEFCASGCVCACFARGLPEEANTLLEYERHHPMVWGSVQCKSKLKEANAGHLFFASWLAVTWGTWALPHPPSQDGPHPQNN